jgi:hypothetical protein
MTYPTINDIGHSNYPVKINCPNGHLTTRYLYSFKDEVNYEDIPIFYCWSCKQEFSFR